MPGSTDRHVTRRRRAATPSRIAARTLPACLALAAPGGAWGQGMVLRPLLDARVRLEHDDEQGSPRDAVALTARIRSGLQATRGRFSALVEAEATLAPIDRYDDGLGGVRGRPLIRDPENIELNRAQLGYGAEGFGVTVGRQRIELLDQRFVGSGAFRQNDQTFDAARVRWERGPLSADLTYAWSVRTPNGINGRGARQQAVSGNDLFALAGYATPIGRLTGFAYIVDFDEAAVQGFRLSSRSFGARLADTRKLGPVGVAYAFSHARQSDHHRNPNSYRAAYTAAEIAGTLRRTTATLGFEVLGADRGLPFTSFQTPAAALVRFQGLINKFGITPPDGVRDVYTGATQGWTGLGWADAATLSAVWHRFSADRNVRPYGREWDLAATARRGRFLYALRWSRYEADGFSTDTDKLWLSVDWVL